ncbi:hypothetical protein E4T66_12190 [Sinimarinibacterium sp. CAU 1509]|uniref:hypothetical protein n=1 Tax=Sinimarinibacterium sp. CAU 1509 TaxID=2562283 RepID=UPI0010ACD369|nr:hypothetical protein [Sinimarinibacterium sp. CAU 1509]TJY59935.1 hypothetical protein E4T66_12190 [Sinimarinibacterium sp. CAU 1509]
MKYVIGLCVALLIGGCDGADRGNRPVPKAEQGREETQGIRNTEAVGYAGDAIADKVDAALDANDERKQQLDAEIDEQTK